MQLASAPRVEPRPAPAPKPTPPPAPRVEAPKPASPAMIPKPITTPVEPKREAAPLDITTLPILHKSDYGKYGLDGMSLNMLREPSKDRPNGLAIINLNKVYPGEVIQGSQARLIGVVRSGIGIEIESTGEQYFIEQ